MAKISKARLLVVLVGGLALARSHEEPLDFVPPNGYVPDEATALAVGRAVLEPVSRKGALDREPPLFATLRRGVWTIIGNKHDPDGHFHGAFAMVHISKKTGAILRMPYGK